MNPQSRMAKTLASLVGAMTAGALVLHWIEPSNPPSDSRYEIQLIALGVRDAVSQDALGSAPTWQGIVVRGADEPQRMTDGSHFGVTDQGRLLAGPNWQAQRPLNTAGYIEVSIEKPPGATVPRGQARTLVTLLTELRRVWLNGRGAIHVDDASLPSDAAAGIHSLLRSAGLIR
jgi:hypothetical protein